MANHKDAVKRNRQNHKRRARNRHYRATMRSQVKALREAVISGNAEAAAQQLPTTVATIHRLAQKGIIHKRQAARRVSRLAKAVNQLTA